VTEEDEIIIAHGASLDEIAHDIRSKELRRCLKELSTEDPKNYATVQLHVPTPDGDIAILTKPSVPPVEGATEICDGELTIAGMPIAVTAYRLPA
jgi:hypothetical protein